jgi:hypothetical protein
MANEIPVRGVIFEVETGRMKEWRLDGKCDRARSWRRGFSREVMRPSALARPAMFALSVGGPNLYKFAKPVL